MYEYKAKIVSVYDGDTVTAEVDLGFSVRIKEKFRLFGINTPEIRGGTPETKAAGYAARDRLRVLVLDKDVVLMTIKDRKGKYGRYLAVIYLDEEDINRLLVNEGHAEEYPK